MLRRKNDMKEWQAEALPNEVEEPKAEEVVEEQKAEEPLTEEKPKQPKPKAPRKTTKKVKVETPEG